MAVIDGDLKTQSLRVVEKTIDLVVIGLVTTMALALGYALFRVCLVLVTG